MGLKYVFGIKQSRMVSWKREVSYFILCLLCKDLNVFMLDLMNGSFIDVYGRL